MVGSLRSAHPTAHRFLASVVSFYVEAYDEEPLPVATAERAYHRLLDLVASVDFGAGKERRLADIDRVAACDLWH